ncbi:MAG: type II toxin-antitoxin system RelE/ParE family toxin [candidate division Zixibacteria bacterium]|nr:type II toxin-antitoxin system RelE/ParE family toxin [candidate division Zixibacteria bacterium]
MYEVFISHEAEKYYRKLDKDTKRKINKCIDILSQEPLLGPHIKRLHGVLKGKYRYEIGALRIVYDVDTKSKTVEIKAMRTRGDVYKRQ